MTDAISKSDRLELGQLIRKRERVLKSAAEERSAAMMAEFEAQCASIYNFDDDKVWAQAMARAQKAVKEAQKEIEARCRQLGIPKEFAPDISVGWYSRGQNAVAERRGELRRVAKTKIEAIEREAITKIERQSYEAQTDIIRLGIESPAGKKFLEQMPSIETLMPSIDATKIKAIVDARHKKEPREQF